MCMSNRVFEPSLRSLKVPEEVTAGQQIPFSPNIEEHLIKSLKNILFNPISSFNFSNIYVPDTEARLLHLLRDEQ